MSRRWVVIGAGGHGREVADAARLLAVSEGAELIGVLAEGELFPERLAAHGFELIGPVALIGDLDVEYVIGIGDPAVRRRIDREASDAGRTPFTLRHPAASVGAVVALGPGAYVAAGAVITANVELGRHAHVNVGATISHDCRLGDYATVGPGCHLGGWCVVGDGADLGVGVVTRPRVTIGAGAVVGAGSVVVTDIPAGTVAYGVPARPRKRYRDE